MWGVGRDTSLRMIVSNLILLDRVPPRSELADRLAAAAAAAPRLRQRPDALPGLRTRPMWVDEEAFDASRHIRTMAVPAPGEHRQILDLVTLLEPSPFDPSMSPWDVTVIEGLEGGRAGLYLRAHHCLTDGLHGVSVLRGGVSRGWSAGSARGPGAGASGDGSGVRRAIEVRRSICRRPHARRRPGAVSVTIDIAGAIHPIANGVCRRNSVSAAANSVSPLPTV